MPRPKPDEDLIRSSMLDAAQELMRRHGAAKVTVTDIAARCGMSQSNAYRYYASRNALFEALGQRCFADIQAALEAVAAGKEDPAAKLRLFLLTQFSIKLARWREDRELFAAYLKLADANPAIAQSHITENHALLSKLVSDWCQVQGMERRRADRAYQLILDATLLIRDPYAIARHGHDLSEARAAALVEAVLAGLASTRDGLRDM
jgi:AcrR family transcriptional regulator